jgi:3-phenylpropionate/trans-cinnamate dioxygenase ferredoxin reductase subunit
LVIATGARPRRLQLPDAALPGVLELRTLADVDKLKAVAVAGKRMVVVGAGYIGLEAAAVSAQLGLLITVLEAMPQALARVAGPEIGAFYTAVHREAGTDFRLGAKLEGFEGSGHLTGARLAGGEVIPCDIALVGIGVMPNLEIAQAAGLNCGNGIVVDASMRTSHPDIYAIGDVAWRPLLHYGREGRLESVHNAIEGGKIAAASILGGAPHALEVPWFWSDQFDLKLQTAGLWTGADQRITRGDRQSRSFAVFYLKEGRVIAVDAVNSAHEYLVGRKLVAASAAVAPAELADKSISMKDIGARALG